MAHGFPVDLVRAQAEALGTQLIAVPTEWEEYEARFRKAIAPLRELGVEAGVFGAIDLPEHREWVERVMREAGLAAMLPLWGVDQTALLREWLSLRAPWPTAVSRLRAKAANTTPWWWTVHFHRLLEILKAVPVLRGQHWMLDIRGFGLGESRREVDGAVG